MSAVYKCDSCGAERTDGLSGMTFWTDKLKPEQYDLCSACLAKVYALVKEMCS